MDDDWQSAPSSSGDYGFSQSLAGMKLETDSWHLSLIKRKDYFLRTNPDSLVLYHFTESEFPTEQVRQYEVDINYRQIKALGIKAGYKIEIMPGLLVSGRLGYWHPDKARHSSLVGDVISDDSKDNNQLSGTAELEEWYTWNNLLRRPGDSEWQQGYGVTFDAEVHWRVNDKLDVKLVFEDLYSKFSFENIGYSKGAINSETSFKDDKNITRFNPAYTGVESQREKDLELPTYRSVLVNTELDIGKLQFHYEKRDIVDFFTLAMEKTLQNYQVNLGYEFAKQSVSVEVKKAWFNLLLSTDNLNLSKAKQLKLSAGLSYQF